MMELSGCKSIQFEFEAPVDQLKVSLILLIMAIRNKVKCKKKKKIPCTSN